MTTDASNFRLMSQTLLMYRLQQFHDIAAIVERQIEIEALPLPKLEDDGFWTSMLRVLGSSFNAFHHSVSIAGLFRRSLFTAAMSMCEEHLNRHVEYLRLSRGLELRLEDTKGNGIERARTFIKDVAGLSFPDQSSTWQHLKQFMRLRNVIVHRYGRLDPVRDKTLVEYCERNGDVLVLPHDWSVWLQRPFTGRSLGVIRELFVDLGYRVPAPAAPRPEPHETLDQV